MTWKKFNKSLTNLLSAFLTNSISVVLTINYTQSLVFHIPLYSSTPRFEDVGRRTRPKLFIFFFFVRQVERAVF